MRTRNVILLVAAGVLLAGAAGAGLSGGNTPAPRAQPSAATSTPVVTPAAEPTPDQSFVPQTNINPDTLFLQSLSKNSAIPASAYNQAKELATKSCEALDAGATMDQVVSTIAEQHTGAESELGYILGAGVQAYCPQYLDQIGAR